MRRAVCSSLFLSYWRWSESGDIKVARASFILRPPRLVSLRFLLLSYTNATCSALTTYAEVPRQLNNFCIATRWIWMSVDTKRARANLLGRVCIDSPFSKTGSDTFFASHSRDESKGKLHQRESAKFASGGCRFAPHRHPCCLVNLYSLVFIFARSPPNIVCIPSFWRIDNFDFSPNPLLCW